jgi:condensin complex subunit 1
MADQINFDLNEALKLYLSDPTTIPTPDADSVLVECESDPDTLTLQVVNAAINPIIDSIAGGPDALAETSSFDTLQFLLKCAPTSLDAQEFYAREPRLNPFLSLGSHPCYPPMALARSSTCSSLRCQRKQT